MNGKFKLIWFAWQPTPYNDFLFQHLGSDPDVDLVVYYRFGHKPSHPWQNPLRLGYKSKVYRGRGARIDTEVLRAALRDDRVWVTAGWPGLTMKAAISILAARKRRFIFWTDTPQLQVVEKGDNPASVVELLADGCPYPNYHAGLRRFLYRLVFKHAGVVMATGEPGVKALKVLGCPPAKAANMPFLVNLPGLSPRKRFSHEAPGAKSVRFFASGQLVRRKGYDLALDALKIVRGHTNKPIEFLIAGDGEERRRLEEQCRSNGIAHEVKFWVWQEPEAVQRLLSSSHAFVHPARYDPFPVAVLEAMASGVMVLGSDAAGSVVDRVDHGVNGSIHPKGDVGSLSEHMLAVVTSPERAIRMGESARAKAEEWPPGRVVSILKEACRRCVNGV